MFIKIKQLIKSTYYLLTTSIGLHHLYRYLNRKKILILMYHGVTEKRSDMFCWWQMEKGKFASQMEYVNKFYTVLPLDRVAKALKEGEDLPPYTAVITFDDGYRNNYSVACPILKKYNLPATIFLTTGFIDTDRLLWPDELYFLFLKTTCARIDLSSYGLGTFSLTSIEEREKACYSLISYVKEVPAAEKQKIIQKVKEALGWSHIEEHLEKEDFLLLTWDQVKRIDSEGLVSFGGHTVSHEILARLSEDEAAREIKDACSAIKEKIGSKSLTFAYPNGRRKDYTDKVKELLKQMNIDCALSTVNGLNKRELNIFDLKRIVLGSDVNVERFKLLASGFFDEKS